MHFLFFILELDNDTDIEETEKSIKNFSLIQNITSIILIALVPINYDKNKCSNLTNVIFFEGKKFNNKVFK